ncbi:hypothetical protein ACNAN0_02790 [Agrilactobacillus fermenti]|uniref:hypothetical protein n=1 Tax=Agrilactobacillus fermenti TaxID=2586909 RepID=UPI001E5099F1|nr:hypothetical protein [Agrilactobacillus fermenti]MCD2256354.1 hypothetical protein [Agrilactobacillus fermenti]
MATTEAQKRAKKKWNEKNKAKAKLYTYRSTTKTFIETLADLNDLQELKQLIAQREANLKASN